MLRRGVPDQRSVAGQRVTTVFDLLLAQYGVHRGGLPGTWPTGLRRRRRALHAGLAGADHRGAGRRRPSGSRREFADNAERSDGRSMILMGAGTNHWFHSDQIYRAFLALIMLTGCQGVNGGGWAHYVGQEKCRPVTGWATLAFGLDWQRPPRQMQGTIFWYLATDQWRYDPFTAEVLASPLAEGRFAGRTAADSIALADPAGLDAELPDVQPQPARPGRRGEARSARIRRNSGRRTEVGPPAVRLRGPGRAGELSALPDGVAGEPARLVGERQRVLPASTCWARTTACGRADDDGVRPQEVTLARRGPERQARPAAVAGLPR